MKCRVGGTFVCKIQVARASKMVRQSKYLQHKPDHLHSIPGIHKSRRENWIPEVFLWPLPYMALWLIHMTFNKFLFLIHPNLQLGISTYPKIFLINCFRQLLAVGIWKLMHSSVPQVPLEWSEHLVLKELRWHRSSGIKQVHC